MQTYKRLGCKMSRGQGFGAEKFDWIISNNRDLSFGGNGNKGVVMAAALANWAEAGLVKFVKGEGWMRVRHEQA